MVLSVPVTRVPVLIETLDAPLLLLGPPGIGKTALVAETAAILAKKRGRILVDLVGEAVNAAEYHGVRYLKPDSVDELIELYDRVRGEPWRYFVFLRIVATQVTPEDLNYPRVHNGAVVSTLPVMLAYLAVKGVEGILFIDEITNVARDDTATMLFALVQEGRVGLAGRLSSGVKIVAAGNPDDVSSVARPLPAPLINRFIVVRVEPPSVTEYIEYLLSRHGSIDEAVIAFLLARGDKALYQPPSEAETFTNYPTPRSWERVAVEAYRLRSIDERLYQAVLEGLLGPRMAAEFYSFVKVKPPEPKQVYEHPSILLKLNLDTRILAMILMAKWLLDKGEEGLHRLAEWAIRVLNSYGELAEEVAMLLRLVVRLEPRLSAVLTRVAVERGVSSKLIDVLVRLRGV